MRINLSHSQTVAGRFGFDINLLLLIIGSVLFLPFYYSSLTIDPVLLPRFWAWSLLTALLLIGISIQIKSRGDQFDSSIATRAIFGPAAAFTVISGLSMINAVNLSTGLFEWLKTFLGFVFFYITCLILNRNKEALHFLAISVTLTGLILALIGILQYHQVAFTSLPGNYWIYATLANKNLLASALFLTLPFTLWGLVRFSKIGGLISHISILCLSYAIALTEARSVWISFFFSAVFIAFVFSRIYKNLKLAHEIKKTLFRRCLTAFFLVCLAVFLAYLSPNPQLQDNPAIAAGDDHSTHATQITSNLPIWSLNTLAERFQLWQISLRMAAKNPFLGVGTGQWKIVMPTYGGIEKFEMAGDRIIEIRFQRPHNDYLWVLAENGVIGFIGYILFYIILVIYTLKTALKAKTTDLKIFSLIMLFGLTGYMLIAFFTFPKERVVHTIFLMLIAASIVTVYHKTFPISRTFCHRKMMRFNMVVLVFVVISGFIGYTHLISEIHTKKALAARSQGDWDRVIAEMDKAYPRFYNLDPTSTPILWYRGMAHYALGHVEKARDDFNRAFGHHPYHVHVLNNLATCHAELNDTDSAVRYYIRTLETFPHFEAGLINLCSLYLALGNDAAVDNVLQRFAQGQTRDRAASIVKRLKAKLKKNG